MCSTSLTSLPESLISKELAFILTPNARKVLSRSESPKHTAHRHFNQPPLPLSILHQMLTDTVKFVKARYPDGSRLGDTVDVFAEFFVECKVQYPALSNADKAECTKTFQIMNQLANGSSFCLPHLHLLRSSFSHLHPLPLVSPFLFFVACSCSPGADARRKELSHGIIVGRSREGRRIGPVL